MSDYPYAPELATAHLSKVEPAFRRVLEQVGPFAMEYTPLDNVFYALLRAIVYQQLSGKAAGTIFGRVEALFEDAPTAEGVGDLTDDELRGAGMSRAKVAAARSLAEHVLKGECPTVQELAGLSDQQVRDNLTGVRGIGVWTVDMLLIFRLGRPDVMPSNDLGVRKGFARMLGLEDMPSPKELAAATESWAPWRSVGSWYMWRALEIELPSGP
jgi:DNA-3-methyladenine glycosylase II